MTYIISIVILSSFVDDFFGCLFFGLICAIFGLIFAAIIDRYISSRYPGYLYTPFGEMRNLARTRITKREKLQEDMLYKMQYMQGIERTIAELNDIFKANRDLKLTRWVVFRAWYKRQIDHMLQYPDIYHLSVEGVSYSKEDDPLYDPNAPDWSLYDRDHYYDDDDDEDDDDFDCGVDKNQRNSMSDALAIGMGIGLVNGLTGGSVFGGGSSGSGS